MQNNTRKQPMAKYIFTHAQSQPTMKLWNWNQLGALVAKTVIFF